ncbi:hypothetical protein [Staphylococcus aureus]|uniref:hypothetical protein n=1 Tax=Staphylococcus aureus TaxID=1280 RepID=UPI001EFF3E0C|nr:hypothetical protein [Staphylococcus aureus]ULW15522.1 hypothetical protein IF722_13600 [Staphylococcus aureus]
MQKQTFKVTPSTLPDGKTIFSYGDEDGTTEEVTVPVTVGNNQKILSTAHQQNLLKTIC